MRRRTLLCAALAAFALTAAPARGSFFPAEPIDGPSGDVTALGDLDLARDGTGALVWLRRDGDADHVFVSRLAGGAWSAPERVDGGLAGASSQPVVAASDNGRLAVAFVSGGVLYGVVRPVGGAWTAPAPIAGGASNPALDMSINGVGYLTFTVPGGSAADVRAARLDATTWTLLDAPLDVDPARDAGDGAAKRSRVAVSADGTALAVWGEDGADGRTHVYGRRVFNLRVSAAPQDLTLGDLEGRAGRGADSPDVDVEDDSSFAWVVFRQSFDDGGTERARIIARRLVGSTFEAPATADALGWGGEGAQTPRIDLNGRGLGLIAAGRTASFQVVGSAIVDDEVRPAERIDSLPNTSAPLPVTALGENGDGLAAWLEDPGFGGGPREVRARYFDDGKYQAQEVLSNPDFGSVDGALGLEAATSRAGDAVIAFVQGGALNRRLVAALFDRPPSAPLGRTTEKYRNRVRPPLAWSPAFDLWGPVRYRVEVDGAAIATTDDTRHVPVASLADGIHRWRVVAVDRRGQETPSRSRLVRVDSTLPGARLKVRGSRRRGRPLRFEVIAADVFAPTASGVRRVLLDFGDGSPPTTLRRVVHRYRRGGRYTVLLRVSDRAGNVTTVKRRLRIGKK